MGRQEIADHRLLATSSRFFSSATKLPNSRRHFILLFSILKRVDSEFLGVAHGFQ
jgi:hypothetical protein